MAEIERAEPVEGEDIELVAEEERLANADALHAAATAAHEALAGDPSSGSYDTADVTSLLAAARSALEAAAQHDAQLAALAGRVSEAAYLLADVAAELASYVESVEADPVRLARGPGAPGRPYPADPGVRRGRRPDGPLGGDLAAVLAWAKAAAARLAELDGDEDKIGALAEQEAELAATVADLAAQLTAARTQTAARFAAEVTAELTALAMPHAQVVVAVTPAQGFGPQGADEVEIRLAAHPGAAALPLQQGRIRRRAVPDHAGHRGGVRRCRPGADVRLRRG